VPSAASVHPSTPNQNLRADSRSSSWIGAMVRSPSVATGPVLSPPKEKEDVHVPYTDPETGDGTTGNARAG